MKEYVINSSICGKDIRRVRELLAMTQKVFASFVCSSKRTIENWESKEEQTITGPIVPLIKILLRRLELAENLLQQLYGTVGYCGGDVRLPHEFHI